MLGGRGLTWVHFHGWLDQHESSCPCGDRSDGTAQGHAILFPESPGSDTLGQAAWMLTFEHVFTLLRKATAGIRKIENTRKTA